MEKKPLTVSKLRRVGNEWTLYLRHDQDADVSVLASLRSIAYEVGRYSAAAARSQASFKLILDIVAPLGLVETGQPHSLAQAVYRYCNDQCSSASFVFVGITQPPHPLVGREIWFPPVPAAGCLKDTTDPAVHTLVYPPVMRRGR